MLRTVTCYLRCPAAHHMSQTLLTSHKTRYGSTAATRKGGNLDGYMRQQTMDSGLSWFIPFERPLKRQIMNTRSRRSVGCLWSRISRYWRGAPLWNRRSNDSAPRMKDSSMEWLSRSSESRLAKYPFGKLIFPPLLSHRLSQTTELWLHWHCARRGYIEQIARMSHCRESKTLIECRCLDE